ncbi:MAG: hypothetical protein DCF31_17990 [Alphaproteobacteria bacterium]|nr:MAG: hypothetical protein DCF31_17990 [Alphaproteobacteria bacterium]
MIDRRTALRWGGGAALGVAGLGLARAIDQGVIPILPRPGLDAWGDWNNGRHNGPLALVAAGVLASSPHNTQPWQFAVGRLGVDIFEVPVRALGAMDPFGRERLAGLGAAIHNMALASTAIGRSAHVRLLPDAGNPLHVARVVLGPEGERMAPHPLVAAIGHRHVDRGGYAGGAIAPAKVAALAATAGSPLVRIALFDAASARGRRFADLTIDATAAIAADADMMAASHSWFRHERRDQDRLKDGLGIATSGVSPFIAAAGAMLPDQPASEGPYWLASTRETALPTASLFGLILVADPWDRRSALLAGMAWQRLHLTATRAGLAAQPLNQLPEMIDRERQLRRPPRFARAADGLLDDVAWRPTFALRTGNPMAPARASPRRPVSEVIGAPARLDWDVEQARAETAAQDAALARRGK